MLSLVVLLAGTVALWLVMFALYRQKERFTLIPFYCMIAVSTLLTHNLADLGFAVTFGMWHFLIASVSFFTTVMLGQLLLYFFEGPRAARLSFWIILGISLFYVGIVSTLGLIVDTSNWVVLNAINIKTYFWSISAISIDVLFIAIFWEVLSRIKSLPIYIRVFLVMFITFVLDAAVFVTGVFWDSPAYTAILYGNIWTRLGLALLVTPLSMACMKLHSHVPVTEEKIKLWEILNFRSDLEKKIRSIEEVLRNERYLAQELKKFQLSVEAANDQIVITDSNGIALYANPALEILTGFTRKEALGLKAGILWGKLMNSDYYEKMWKTIKEDKKTYVGEITNRRKSGARYEALIKISPVLADDGEVKYFVAIERDITHEKQLDRAKDEFVSVASHELRTPMTAIKGFASMIMDGDYGKVPDKLKGPIADIATSTDRLIHLVNDMLNLSRIEAGRLKFDLKECSPASVIRQTVESLIPIAKQKGLQLSVDHVDEASIIGDKDKIVQVLNNLIGNSLKFTNKGSIRVYTELDGLYYKIFVEDEGLGIAKDDESRIFGKFEQVSTVVSGKPEGTGLGLYISRQVARKMGGDVWLEKTKMGKGSTFGYSLVVSGSSKAKMIVKQLRQEAIIHTDQKELL